MAYPSDVELFRTSFYERSLKRLRKLGASTDDISAMEDAIANDPEAGAVIPGLGGLRKIRFGYGHVGKSGGGRTIYFAVVNVDRVILLVAFAKADQSDLSAKEKKQFAKLAKDLTDG